MNYIRAVLPALGPAPAQQDHRGRREGAGSRLWLYELLLARHVCAEQQRHHSSRQERGENLPHRLRRLLGERYRCCLRKDRLRSVERSGPNQHRR